MVARTIAPICEILDSKLSTLARHRLTGASSCQGSAAAAAYDSVGSRPLRAMEVGAATDAHTPVHASLALPAHWPPRHEPPTV